MAITNRRDTSADLVVQRCYERGIELYRFNTEDYPARIGLDLDPLNPETASLWTDHGPVHIGRARGIWLRRPDWPTIDSTIEDPLDRDFATQESIAALGGLLRLMAHRCVSSPDALQAGRWKLPNLYLASSLGLRVPETIITSLDASARKFSISGKTVAKAAGDARAAHAGRERYGYTIEVEPNEEFPGLRAAPVTFQRLIDKGSDIRVTLVGERTFAVEIILADNSPIDFRATDPDDSEYRVHTLPIDVELRLHAFRRRLGLRFAAIDLIRDGDGVYWFLECNPNGQWAWLEPETGLDITGALVDELVA